MRAVVRTARCAPGRRALRSATGPPVAAPTKTHRHQGWSAPSRTTATAARRDVARSASIPAATRGGYRDETASRGILSFCPTFSRFRFTPGLASAMSLALMPKSLAILAAESPFDTVIKSGGNDTGAAWVTLGGDVAWLATAGAGRGSTVPGGFSSFAN